MRLTLGLALVVLSSCGRPPPPTPESGYRAFAGALREGDAQRAWQALSPETRQLMEARSKAVAGASQGMIKDSPALMLVLSGVKPLPLGEVRLLRADGRTATVEVGTGAEKQSVELVKDGERWTVDLTRMFKK